MQSRDYIISERFIHDDLLERAELAVKHVYEMWKSDGHIDPSLLTWPAEALTDDNGKKLDGICCLTLPNDSTKKTLAIRQMVERTKAYALLLVEQREKDVMALLETPHGTRCWKIKIVRSGDVDRLGDVEIHDDRESVGLLWSSNRGVS